MFFGVGISLRHSLYYVKWGVFVKLTAKELADFNKALAQKSDDAMKTFDKELDIAVNKLSAEGWTLPGEWGVFLIKRLANTNEIDDLNTFLQWYFTQEDSFHVKRMVDYISHSKIKNNIKKLFDECWQAYQMKLYAVCSTTLLAVIEGILSEFSDDRRDIRMMKVCQSKVDSFPENGSLIEKHIWKSYNLFIRNLYHKSDFTSTEPPQINRHWLLHGRSAYEISELDCIRLINSVHSLCIIYDTESQSNGQSQ